MVKPALTALDIITRAEVPFSLPLPPYFVSGEYSMIKAAGVGGWMGTRPWAKACWPSKRAGTDRGSYLLGRERLYSLNEMFVALFEGL